MLVDLWKEINARVLAGHPDIILAALMRLLDEAEAETTRGCTYSNHFDSYVHLHSNIIRVKRYLEATWPNGDTALLDKAEQRVLVLRTRRYENVCGRCRHCRTRRKRWPDITNFVRSDALTESG